MSQEAGGSVKEATALNVTLEVPLMDDRWETNGLFFFLPLFSIFKTKSSANERERETGQRGKHSEVRAPKKKKKKGNGNSLCVSPHVDVCRVFVDARELGKSRVRTNHSVAGIHYYRREYVPKSTLRSPPFLSSSLPFTSESSGTFFFFFFFFKAGETWAYFMVPSPSEQSREKW